MTALLAAPTTSQLTLRPYQLEALEAIERAEARGLRRLLVALPTGTGKTLIFGELIRRRGGRSLVLAHREELLDQAAAKIRMVDPGAVVGVVQAGRDEVAAPTIVASIQTLARPHRLARLGRDFKTIVVDEAHHAAAETYRRVLEQLGAFEPGGPLVVGFTATPQRGDRVALDSVFEELAFERKLLPMVRDGYLCDLRAVQVELELDLDAVHTRHGDFLDGELSDGLLAADAPAHAVAAYQQHAAGRKTLLFAPTVAAAQSFAEAFQAAGLAAEFLSGTTPRDERRAMLDRFRSGETSILANCLVLGEGFDEPAASCVIVARPTQSKPLYLQLVGRIARPHPTKRDGLVIDLVGASRRHTLMTLASLSGLAPKVLERRPVGQAYYERLELERRGLSGGQLVAREVDLMRGSDLHWIAVGERFVLPLGVGHLLLEPTGGGFWSVVRLDREGRRRTLATGLFLDYGQGLAEDFARREGAAVLLDPGAPWRRDEPTDRQRAFIRRSGYPIDTEGRTRGEVADLITAWRVLAV